MSDKTMILLGVCIYNLLSWIIFCLGFVLSNKTMTLNDLTELDYFYDKEVSSVHCYFLYKVIRTYFLYGIYV